MQLSPERRVPLLERNEQRAPRLLADWEAVRVFLDVARSGSFRSASERHGQSVNALRRRVEELERQLGVTLLTRHIDGVRPTDEGEQVLACAQRMEQAAFDLVRSRGQAEPAIAGEVRLAVTEGLGTFWLAPRLIEFQRAYPRMLVDLSCAMRSADVLRLEADLAVQLIRPQAKDLKIVRLGRLHAMPFASRSYIDTYGLPINLDELRKHRIVLQVAEQVTSEAEYDQLFPGMPQPGFVAIRTNVSSAHFWSVTKGAGIGMLPTYAEAIGANLVPVDIGLHAPFDIWLTYHPDSNRIPRVRRMIEWVVDAFDARQYPWFRDEFIHPNDLPKEYRGRSLVDLFAGFGLSVA